jgi:menin
MSSGKGIEDKRGQPVRLGEDENSWLYLKGHAVHCTRHMEIASIVSSINFGINAALNSSELIEIQRLLLWQLYDAGHLAKYPMALCKLVISLRNSEDS